MAAQTKALEVEVSKGCELQTWRIADILQILVAKVRRWTRGNAAAAAAASSFPIKARNENGSGRDGRRATQHV